MRSSPTRRTSSSRRRGDGASCCAPHRSATPTSAAASRWAPARASPGGCSRTASPCSSTRTCSSDPRVKYFPELEEEKYQSLVSVPLVLKGDRMIGVIALHAEAPRVFSAEDAAFLIHVASLVAQAIENARLYERTRRSLRELEHLSRLGSAIARAESIDELLASAVEVGRTLVRAESLGVYLVEASGDSLRLRAAAGGDVEGPEVVSLPDLGVELRRTRARWGEPDLGARGNALGRSGDALGARRAARGGRGGAGLPRRAPGRRAACERARPRSRQLARDADRRRAQAPPADRSTGRAQPHQGPVRRPRRRRRPAASPVARGGSASTRGAARGRWCAPPCAARRRRAERGVPPRERAARGRRRCATSPDRSPIAGGLPAAARAARLAGRRAARAPRGARRRAAEPARRRLLQRLLGPARVRGGHGRGTAGRARGARHPSGCATSAVRRARALQVPSARSARRTGPGPAADALRALRDHDRRRQSQLLRTLEEFLRQRGNMAATAQALYVHPNTLRQRLRRIGEITGIDAREADWLMLEIACKLSSSKRSIPPRAHLDD